VLRCLQNLFADDRLLETFDGLRFPLFWGLFRRINSQVPACTWSKIAYWHLPVLWDPWPLSPGGRRTLCVGLWSVGRPLYSFLFASWSVPLLTVWGWGGSVCLSQFAFF
jgi:hypothetical protein